MDQQQQLETHSQQQQQQMPQLHIQVPQHQQPQHQQIQPSVMKLTENGTSKSSDRSKRDEWSEEAVGILLNAYESKWLLRNRAKLKGNDWEDVATQVSTRTSGSKTPKSQSQCKNKIESMKKRYRAEAASICNPGSGNSSWPFFARMDALLRCSSSPQPRTNGTCVVDARGQQHVLTDLGMQVLPKVEIDDSEMIFKSGHEGIHEEVMQEIPNQITIGEPEPQIQDDSNHDDGSNTLPNKKESIAPDSDMSSPRSKFANLGEGSAKGNSSKKRKSITNEVAESIRCFAESILKLEQAKMEMYRDSERLRADMELRRTEMELKRTEIIANTQLQIAKLFSGKKTKRKPTDKNGITKAPLATTEAAPSNGAISNMQE